MFYDQLHIVECGVSVVIYLSKVFQNLNAVDAKRLHTFVVCSGYRSRPRKAKESAMKTSANTNAGRDSYIPPTTELIVIQHERALLAVSGGDDDDNTGGTGHNMPWDD